jgi:hypothetical protein
VIIVQAVRGVRVDGTGLHEKEPSGDPREP